MFRRSIKSPDKEVQAKDLNDKNFLTDQSDYLYHPSPDPSSDPFGSDYLTYPTDDGLSELSADSQMADLNSNYNAAKEKQWSGKLDSKWKGPYYIHQIVINRSYKLRTMDGKVLTTPVNGTLLKMYYDRQDWKPMIVI